MGGVRIGFKTKIPLRFSQRTRPFRCDRNVPDIWVEIEDAEEFPSISADAAGDDGIFRYYRQNGGYYEKAIGGTEGSVSLAVYKGDFSELKLYINKRLLSDENRTVDKILQFLPMRQVLACYESFLLHSSRIAVGGKAILFTAPSQTGKTTQAKLWERYVHARIIGNDRTLIRKNKAGFATYGYPVDGSSPVCSSECCPLGAIAVLRQSADNEVCRLSASQALRFLMEQTAVDVWNREECMAIQMLWLDLLEKYPVYLLDCRPDKEAVACLKKQLEKDEVIPVAICS